MRRADAGPGRDPVETEAGIEIALSDPTMKKVMQALRHPQLVGTLN